MKNLFVLLMIFGLVACSNKGLGSTKDKSGLTLIDAYQKTTTGGKESDAGTHTSTSYSILVKMDKGVELDKVYINGERYDYEAFDKDGTFYIIVQIYPEFPEQGAGEMIETDAAADIYFTKNGGDLRVLKVPSFRVKEATIGK